MKVHWGETPDEVATALAPLLDQWALLLPRWIERLSVCWETEPKESFSLSVSVEPEYRQATMLVHPGFLAESPETRSGAVLHEFVHIPVEQPRDVFRSLRDATSKEGDPLWEWATEEYRRAMEACVTDLQLGIQRLVDGVAARVAA